MTPEGITRKLIAILSADVKDYTRLMSQDDVGTIHTLTACKEAMETLIRCHRGQVADAIGDGLCRGASGEGGQKGASEEMGEDRPGRRGHPPHCRWPPPALTGGLCYRQTARMYLWIDSNVPAIISPPRATGRPDFGI